MLHVYIHIIHIDIRIYIRKYYVYVLAVALE